MANPEGNTQRTPDHMVHGHAGWILVAVIFAILALIPKNTELRLLAPLVGLGLVAVIMLLTRPLDDDRDLAVVFQVGYGFLAILAAGSLYLILRDQPLMLGGDDSCIGSNHTRVCPAIAVVPGCDYVRPGSRRRDEDRAATEDETDAAMPANAQCGDIPPQWVLSLGGSILRCHIDGDCPQQPEDSGRPAGNWGIFTPLSRLLFRLLADAEQGPSELRAEWEAKETERQRLREAARAAQSEVRHLQRLASAQAVIDAERLKNQAETAQRASTRASKLDKEIEELGSRMELYEQQRSIPANVPGRPIVGGLVVPLYFVILAILGAMVSMARKLPEYH